jgi:hypothetical protein
MAVKGPFNYIVTNAPLQGGEKWQDISEAIIATYNRRSTEVKDKIDEAIEGKLQKAGAWYANLQGIAKVNWDYIIDSTPAMNKDALRTHLNSISSAVEAMSGYDIDHREITFVNSRIALTINVLQGALKVFDKGLQGYQDEADFGEPYDAEKDLGGASSAGAVGMRRQQILEGRKGVLGVGEGAPRDNIQNAITELQKLLAVSERMQYNMNQTGESESFEDVIAELEGEGGVITLDKQKYIDAMDGRADAVFRFETPTFNRDIKGARQKEAGILRAKLTGASFDLSNDLQYQLDTLLGSTLQVTGSKRIDAVLLQQLEDAFLRRKKKVQKTNSKKKVRTKRIKVKRGKAASIAKTQRNIAKEIKTFALAAGIKKTKRRRPDGQRKLNIFKENINAKLKAAVTKNMVRPALEPRTGTFAGSVKLDSLVQGPNTIIGEYSYQEDPYSTFENSGRWPNGYNPKPLITKSIRELATKALGAKFTLRKAAI